MVDLHRFDVYRVDSTWIRFYTKVDLHRLDLHRLDLNRVDLGRSAQTRSI